VNVSVPVPLVIPPRNLKHVREAAEADEHRLKRSWGFRRALKWGARPVSGSTTHMPEEARDVPSVASAHHSAKEQKPIQLLREGNRHHYFGV
jgi:hypothetical protein